MGTPGGRQRASRQRPPPPEGLAVNEEAIYYEIRQLKQQVANLEHKQRTHEGILRNIEHIVLVIHRAIKK